MPDFKLLARLCAVAAGFIAVSAAQAAAPATAGKRALLTLNIQIDGDGQRTSRSDGVDVKWSTHRTLEAKVEMVATKPERMSAASVKTPTSGSTQPSSGMEALQKEIEKCKPDDTACQMAVAMKMMETEDARKVMAEDDAAQAAPVRYQTWEPAPKGGRVEVTGEYQEQWDGIFLTASREVRNCKSAFSSAAPRAATVAKDRETLRNGLTGLHVEVDTQTGKSSLMLVVGSYVASESNCHINDGGRIFDEKDNKNLLFAPPIDTEATGGWVAGGTAVGAAISRGELNIVTKPAAQSMSGMMSVTAPLKVKLRWELVPL